MCYPITLLWHEMAGLEGRRNRVRSLGIKTYEYLQPDLTLHTFFGRPSRIGHPQKACPGRWIPLNPIIHGADHVCSVIYFLPLTQTCSNRPQTNHITCNLPNQ